MSLSSFYLGLLGIQPLGSLNPKASVEVFGDVDSLDAVASPIHILESVTLDNTGRTSTSNAITAASVPDGNYEFKGSLTGGAAFCIRWVSARSFRTSSHFRRDSACR